MARTEEVKKALIRAQEVMAQNHGGRDADPSKAVETQGWEQLWQEGITPWATLRINAPMTYLFEKEQGEIKIPRGGKALVPGCGRGDDVVIFGKLGYDSLGIDLSPTAVQHANEWLKTVPKEENDGKIEVRVENFFNWAPAETFQLIYDYTFFVAIPPTIRAAWGESMTRLIAPGGFLATLVFPIDGARQDGPPYSVSLADYQKVLKEEEWEIVLDEVPPNLQGPLVGRARVVFWKSLKKA